MTKAFDPLGGKKFDRKSQRRLPPYYRDMPKAFDPLGGKKFTTVANAIIRFI